MPRRPFKPIPVSSKSLKQGVPITEQEFADEVKTLVSQISEVLLGWNAATVGAAVNYHTVLNLVITDADLDTYLTNTREAVQLLKETMATANNQSKEPK